MNIKQNIKILAFFVCAALLLTGCGFHLRGKINLPPTLHTFYLDGNSPYTSLIRNLRKQLQHSDITLVDSPNKAPVTLFVISENLSNTQTTIGSSGSLRDYTVTYVVTYVLRNSFSQPIAGPFSVSASTTVTVLQNEMLNNSNKLNLAEKILEQNVIVKIMYQISSQDTLAALTKSLAQQKNSKPPVKKPYPNK